MPEIRQKIISCPSGHYYDANKYSSCPYCSSGSFSQTTDPFADIGASAMSPTEIPSEAGSFSGTVYPGAAASTGGFMDTVPPDGVRGYDGGNFNSGMGQTTYVIPGDNNGATDEVLLPCVGWLVMVEGPHRGIDYRIHAGYNFIGRNTGDICIRGDDTISGEKDSSITYVYQTNKFYIAHEQGKNVLLVNNIPVMGGGAELHDYDIITIGTTKLIFVGLCGEKFSWEDKERS